MSIRRAVRSPIQPAVRSPLLRAMGGGAAGGVWNDLFIWDDAQVWSD